MDSKEYIKHVKDEYDFILAESIVILGVEYRITYCEKDAPVFENGAFAGICDYTTKDIYLSQDCCFKDSEPDTAVRGEYNYRCLLRHEATHAFFHESGLAEEFSPAVNETLIDWIALQFPKMLNSFDKANAI